MNDESKLGRYDFLERVSMRDATADFINALERLTITGDIFEDAKNYFIADDVGDDPMRLRSPIPEAYQNRDPKLLVQALQDIISVLENADERRELDKRRNDTSIRVLRAMIDAHQSREQAA